jgi:sugar phosphate isomerase/epimerase
VGLGAAAMAAGRPGAAPGAAAATAKKGRWPMRLSTSSIHFSKLPIEQAVERIARLGFEAIDIWSAHAGCPHLDDVAKRLGAEGLKRLLAKHRLKLYAFSVYRGGYAKYAELLGKAGGGVAIRGSTRPCKPAELTARMKAFLESLKPLAELAARHNSYLAIENHGNALLDRLDSFKAFVDLNRNDRLGIAMAPYHLQRRKVRVPEAIRVVGKQLLFFYAWQSAKGTGQLPGIGKTDFTPWLTALAEVRYRWYVNPFMHHEPAPDAMAAALGKSRDYLKQCYEKAVPK